MDSRFDLVRIFRTAVWVVTSPVQFFQAMPRKGGYTEPLIFLVVMGFVGVSLQAVFGIAGLRQMELDLDTVSLILMMSMAIVVSGFVAAAIYFVLWRLMGSQESFETAFRCNAYISALIPVSTVLSLVPFLAPVASVVLSTIFLVLASIHVHNIPGKRAWLVFGILGLVFLLISVTGDITVRGLKESSENRQRIDGAGTSITAKETAGGSFPGFEERGGWKPPLIQ